MQHEDPPRTALIVEDHPLYRGALVDLLRTVSAVFRALGVVNRTQAVLAMRRLGLDEG